MGIKNLNYLIEKYSSKGKETISLSSLKGFKLAIDTNVYLYKFLYGKNNHIDGVFFMVNKLKKFGIEPLFIFDGKPPEEKKETIEQRKQAKLKMRDKIDELEQKLVDTTDIVEKEELAHEIENIEKRIIYVDKDIVNSTKQLLELMGIDYIHCNCEAEQYCSFLYKKGLVNGVITEDMDTIASGCHYVYRNFSNRVDTITCYSLYDILSELNICYYEFLDLCILLGNDYIARHRGLSPEDCYSLIKEYGSIEKIVASGILYYETGEYTRIRQIYSLSDIQLITIEKPVDKKVDIELLKQFLKEKSTIDERIYRSRIEMIYNSDRQVILERSKYVPKYKSKLVDKKRPISFLTECLIEDDE